MSKEKKFHNLIEKDGREEKKRVWEKIQADDNSAQPLSVEKERRAVKRAVFSSRVNFFRGRLPLRSLAYCLP